MPLNLWEIILKSRAKSQCEDIRCKVLLFHVTHAYVLLLLFSDELRTTTTTRALGNLYRQSQDFELLNKDFSTDY